MAKLSETITSRTATDEQILDFLADRFPGVRAGLDSPSEDYIIPIFELAVNSGGWEKVGKQVEKTTLLAFWRDALDLAHLRQLDIAKPVKKVEIIPASANAFDALEEEDSTEIAMSKPSEAESEGEQDEWNFLFKAAPLDEDWNDMLDGSDIASSMTSSDSEDSVPAAPPTPPVDMNEVLAAKEDFLKHFGYLRLPKIPHTNRDLDILLQDEDVWSFSAAERLRVFEFVAMHAKEDIDEDSIEEFESLEKRHALLRASYAEVKDNVGLSRGIRQ
jgi:hypothetical protein